MPRRPLVAPLALALGATLLLPGAAAGAHATAPSAPASAPASALRAAATYDAGLSTPVEDSYYPDKGDPTVDALHYRLQLTWRRPARVLVGRSTMVMRATRDDDAIRLDLSRRLTVRRVLVDGARVGFDRERDHLVVHAPTTAERRYTVRVVYAGTPGPSAGPASRSDIARLGMRVTQDGQLWTMQEPYGAFTWYPVNDHPSDKALYDVRVDAPGSWVGVSNGRLVLRRNGGGRTVTRWVNRDPVASYLMTLAVGPYVRYRQTGPRGLPITYWVPRDARALVKPLLRTPDALGWLERRLGRFPFDRVGVVITPGSTSAMETQTLVTLGRGFYAYGAFQVRSVVVHELAHQWYGDTVTPRDWRDVWMNEGVATYLNARWDDEHSGNPWHAMAYQLEDWRLSDQAFRDLYGPPGAYFPDEFGSENVYYSAALMWERLRRRLGDATFDRLLRAWPQTRRNSNADREQLVRFWERGSGVELSAFFGRWLTSPRSPA